MTHGSGAPRNALANETSPYLLQHAANPVAWHPWGDAALARARAEHKPILLSIGYSACHWCHVMAHESFEDSATAAVMNEHFINIKVDREERPDLDKIYQTAQHLLTRNQGGWPLTMFLTPDDHIPFFGGTYFPPQPRHGLPGFKDLLVRVAQFYREREADIRAQNAQLRDTLAQIQDYASAAADAIDAAPLAAARAQSAATFERRSGGFGHAPKFPHPTNIERLLRDYAASRALSNPDDAARHMALFTLECMARGGIYDHLGGGFCRYSVDDHWMIPHFEKMLYDNGPLLSLYCDAWQLTGEPLFEQTARETADWVLREMTSPDGAFYSSLDADSEGEEGKYYVWDREAVRIRLGAEYAPFARRYGLDRPANFEGRWHLRICAEYPEIAQQFDSDVATVAQRIAAARAALLATRAERVRPGRDDKILTAWNALMVKGMATAARVLQEPRYTLAASRALDFIRSRMWHDGRLLATCKDGRAHLPAYLDDYAFTLDALLNLLTVRWSAADLHFACALAEALLAHFEDRQTGGFYFTAHDHEPLIQRTKSTLDDALPAGTGIAAWALGRLGHLLGETRYLAAAEGALRAAWEMIERAPSAHNALLLALEEYLVPPRIIILRGVSPALEAARAICLADYAPAALCLAVPAVERELPGLLAERSARGPLTAYVCAGHACQAPITDLADLAALRAAMHTTRA